MMQGVCLPGNVMSAASPTKLYLLQVDEQSCI